MRLLIAIISAMLLGLSLNATVNIPERTDQYFLLSWPHSSTVYRVNYPEMDEFEPLPDYPELNVRASRWEITGTHESNFIVAVYVDYEIRFYLLDPESKVLSYLVTLYGRGLEYKFKHRHFHFFMSFDRSLHILDTKKLIFIHHQLKHVVSEVSQPDENGIFYDLTSSGINPKFPQTMTQYRISEDGLEATGVESLLPKGDLMDFLEEDYAGITDFGPGYILAASSIFDIDTGDWLGTQGEGKVIDAGQGYLLKYLAHDDELVIRSFDGSKQAVYPTDGSYPEGIIDGGDAYHVYYASYDSNLNKVLAEQIIPKIAPVSSNTSMVTHLYPKSPYINASIAAMDESSFMYQIPLAGGGMDVAIVNIPERQVEASLNITKSLRHPPFFDSINNSLWFQGYELSLRENDKYQLNWRFDAFPSSLNDFFKLGNRIYFKGFPSGYYDLVKQEVVPTKFPSTSSDNLMTGATGKLYISHGTYMEVFDSEEEFLNGTPLIVETPLHQPDRWISNDANTLWANAHGQIIRNEDIGNPVILDPFVMADLIDKGPIAVHGEKVYKTTKAQSAPGLADEISWLHVWNNDGSQHSRTPLPPNLVAPIHNEVPNGVNWDVFTTGNQLFLLACIGTHEVFLFDFDEQAGEVLGLDDPVAARLSYMNSYDSFLYGRIHDVDDNWKYSPEDGWMFLREQKDNYIEWDDYYGFISRPKYTTSYMFDYDEGWKAWVDEINGYNWYYDFTYRYLESDFPSLAPQKLVDRHIHVYDSTGTLAEYWNITSETTADLTMFALEEPGAYEVPIIYLNPLEPDNNVVRLEFDTNNFLSIGGYYEFTFLTKFEGNLRSDLTVPDPDQPGAYINVKAEGTFRIVLPEEGPAGN